MNLYEVLGTLEDDSILHDTANDCDVTVRELATSGDSDLVEPAVLENGEIFFATEEGEAIDPSEPVYLVQ